MATEFTDGDVVNGQWLPAEREDLIRDEPDWMRRGLQQTRTGYGAKLNSGLKVRFNGKTYRLYQTCYSNAASTWFMVRGRKIFIR